MLPGLTAAFFGNRFISFYEAINVNSAVTHLVGFLVLLATVQLWDLLQHNPRLQVISKTLSKDWDEVVGFLLIILVLLSGYAMTVSPMSSASVLKCLGFEIISLLPVQAGNEFWRKGT
jgi:hypothetical protein